jgi:hypothetical protein
MSGFGDSPFQGAGRFVVWAALCDAAEAFWVELGAREDLPMALELAKASYDLGHAARHYLGVRVTDRDAHGAQSAVYEKLVPDLATRIAKAQPVRLAARRRAPSDN